MSGLGSPTALLEAIFFCEPALWERRCRIATADLDASDVQKEQQESRLRTLDFDSVLKMRQCSKALNQGFSLSLIFRVCRNGEVDVRAQKFVRLMTVCLSTELVTNFRETHEMRGLQELLRQQRVETRDAFPLAACELGKSDVLTWLLNIAACSSPDSERGQRLVHNMLRTACEGDWVNIVETLLAWLLSRTPAGSSTWHRFRACLPDDINFAKDILQPLCERRSSRLVRVLLQQTAYHDCADALIGSARRQDLATVLAFLEAGVHPDIEGEKSQTALIAACDIPNYATAIPDRLSVIRLVANKSCNVLHQRSDGVDAFQAAASIDDDRTSLAVLDILLSAPSFQWETSAMSRALATAVMTGNVGTVKRLVDRGALLPRNSIPGTVSVALKTARTAKALMQCREVPANLDALIQFAPASRGGQQSAKPALMFACEQGYCEAVDVLLAHNANPLACAGNGRSVLTTAQDLSLSPRILRSLNSAAQRHGMNSDLTETFLSVGLDCAQQLLRQSFLFNESLYSSNLQLTFKDTDLFTATYSTAEYLRGVRTLNNSEVFELGGFWLGGRFEMKLPLSSLCNCAQCNPSGSPSSVSSQASGSWVFKDYVEMDRCRDRGSWKWTCRRKTETTSLAGTGSCLVKELRHLRILLEETLQHESHVLRLKTGGLYTKILECCCSFGWWHLVEPLVTAEDSGPVVVHGRPLLHVAYIHAALSNSDTAAQVLERLLALPHLADQLQLQLFENDQSTMLTHAQETLPSKCRSWTNLTLNTTMSEVVHRGIRDSARMKECIVNLFAGLGAPYWDAKNLCLLFVSASSGVSGWDYPRKIALQILNTHLESWHLFFKSDGDDWPLLAVLTSGLWDIATRLLEARRLHLLQHRRLTAQAPGNDEVDSIGASLLCHQVDPESAAVDNNDPSYISDQNRQELLKFLSLPDNKQVLSRANPLTPPRGVRRCPRCNWEMVDGCCTNSTCSIQVQPWLSGKSCTSARHLQPLPKRMVELILDAVLDLGSEQLQRNCGEEGSVLHIAIQHRCWTFATSLARAWSTPEHLFRLTWGMRSGRGRTPLHLAVLHHEDPGSVEEQPRRALIDQILQSGAPGLPSFNEQMAIEEAIYIKDWPVLSLLMARIEPVCISSRAAERLYESLGKAPADTRDNLLTFLVRMRGGVDILDAALQKRDTTTLTRIAQSGSELVSLKLRGALRDLLSQASGDSDDKAEAAIHCLINVPASVAATVLVDAESTPCRTCLLSVAVIAGRHDTVSVLLEHLSVRAAINSQDVCGCTPLHHACRHSDETSARFVRMLLGCGADSSVRSEGGYTALLIAAQLANHQTVVELLSQPECARESVESGAAAASLSECSSDRDLDVNVASDDGTRPLLAACRLSGEASTHTVRALLERRADLDLADRAGQTPLMAACAAGCEENILLLLDAGASLNLQDQRGRTAYRYLSFPCNVSRSTAERLSSRPASDGHWLAPAVGAKRKRPEADCGTDTRAPKRASAEWGHTCGGVGCSFCEHCRADAWGSRSSIHKCFQCVDCEDAQRQVHFSFGLKRKREEELPSESGIEAIRQGAAKRSAPAILAAMKRAPQCVSTLLEGVNALRRLLPQGNEWKWPETHAQGRRMLEVGMLDFIRGSDTLCSNNAEFASSILALLRDLAKDSHSVQKIVRAGVWPVKTMEKHAQVEHVQELGNHLLADMITHARLLVTKDMMVEARAAQRRAKDIHPASTAVQLSCRRVRAAVGCPEPEQNSSHGTPVLNNIIPNLPGVVGIDVNSAQIQDEESKESEDEDRDSEADSDAESTASQEAEDEDEDEDEEEVDDEDEDKEEIDDEDEDEDSEDEDEDEEEDEDDVNTSNEIDDYDSDELWEHMTAVALAAAVAQEGGESAP